MRYFIIVLAMLASHAISAQYTYKKNYPQGYFIYPVKSAVGLNANFGELRPNHWHMGLDCKTERRENVDLLAAADGYIAKVKIEPFGFGRAIYINHPNGYTTLYAHCNDFYPELENYVKKEQYKRKTWRIFLDSIPANLLPVKKGQFIAKSGNTGGSLGPHLHFEIRDTKSDKVLNPQLFGFNIPDNVKPIVTKVVVYDRCQSVYEQNAKIITAGGINAAPINIKTEQVSFAIAATDAVSGNANPNGIYEAVVYDNGVALCGFQMDSIGYDETRYLNAHIDYKMKVSGGSYVQHLSKLPGYQSGVYRQFKNDGIVDIADGKVHKITIVVKDAAGNATTLYFNIQNKDAANTRCKDVVAGNFNTPFYANFPNAINNGQIKFQLLPNALYDSIDFKYGTVAGTATNYYSPIHKVHTSTVPVHTTYTLAIKPNQPIRLEDKNKMVIKRWYEKKFEVLKAIEENGWYKADFKGFGNFVLMADRTPPKIIANGIKDGANMSKVSGFSFTVVDDNEDLKNFSATLDGNWLLFSNDKGKTFKHKFDERTTPGAHKLVIYVEDEAGNASTQTINFTK